LFVYGKICEKADKILLIAASIKIMVFEKLNKAAALLLVNKFGI